MLDTGILRYFFTGGRDLLILVNGRPYATTAHNLDSLPLSAVERIEVLRGESLGTIGGHAAVRGAFNLVLRKDLDGFDVRTVARMPSRDGGDARQGSVVWGGEIGAGGHMTVGVDVLDRQEIEGSTREHSRSEWEEGGSFADAKNVSVGGNTVLIFDTSELALRTVPLGECAPELGYTGPLSNPPGIDSGDKGCGFAYGQFWWDRGSYEQENAILNLDHPLGEHAELHVDANVTQGRSAFRYAPSVDVFSVTPSESLLDGINASAGEADPAFVASTNDIFAVGHRFIGHGNRDWRTSFEEYDASASVEGRLSEDLGYDAEIGAYRFDGSVSGDTFVGAEIIGEEIEAGTVRPRQSSLDGPAAPSRDREEQPARGERLPRKVSGRAFRARGRPDRRIGERASAWTAGVELEDVEAHSLLMFRSSEGQTRDVERGARVGRHQLRRRAPVAAGAFAEMSLPLVRVRGREGGSTGRRVRRRRQSARVAPRGRIQSERHRDAARLVEHGRPGALDAPPVQHRCARPPLRPLRPRRAGRSRRVRATQRITGR